MNRDHFFLTNTDCLITGGLGFISSNLARGRIITEPGMKAQRKEKASMMPFDKCPICGGELVEKQVEKIVRGGKDTAILHVRAEVCLRCGERLYSQETVRRFEEIRAKLERHEIAGFQPLGVSFQVPA